MSFLVHLCEGVLDELMIIIIYAKTLKQHPEQAKQ